MNRFRLVLADDHHVLREGLRIIINNQPDLVVVAEAASGAEALERLRETGARLISLDLAMPGGNSIQTIKRIRAELVGVRILVLTMHDEPEYVRSAMAAGADGYLLKSTQTDVYLSGLRAVAAGQRIMEPLLQGHLETPRLESSTTMRSLSRREREILDHLALGLTHGEIADRLFVSEKTIETYRHRIKVKTGLKTRADFVRFGHETLSHEKRLIKDSV
jgi:DNA-binding NarL/FixJ family response regulator